MVIKKVHPPLTEPRFNNNCKRTPDIGAQVKRTVALRWFIVQQ